MTTRAEIIAEARTWIGTPWQHQGRLKGIAADCAGVVIGVGKACGCIPDDGSGDRTDYGMLADPIRMRTVLDMLFDKIPIIDMRPGDIPWMRGGIHPQHIGVYTERNTLIHAVNNRRVEELPVDEFRKGKLVGLYRYRGIEEVS